MAVTPFRFLPLFKMPTLQGILNPYFSLFLSKLQAFKQYSRISRFLLLRQDYSIQWQFGDHRLPEDPMHYCHRPRVTVYLGEIVLMIHKIVVE